MLFTAEERLTAMLLLKAKVSDDMLVLLDYANTAKLFELNDEERKRYMKDKEGDIEALSSLPETDIEIDRTTAARLLEQIKETAKQHKIQAGHDAVLSLYRKMTHVVMSDQR